MEEADTSMAVEREIEATAGDETTKLGLTPHGWPPEPMTVKGLDDDSWASTCGAQVGDRLIRINNRDVQEMDKKGIIQCFKERPVTITFSREVPTITAGVSDDRLGMQPGNWPPGLVHVRHVEEDSWADRNGIDCGSTIVAVNGLATETMNMNDFRTMLRERPVTLAIARPGELTEVQSPSAMTQGLRFSILPGSPGDSPMAGWMANPRMSIKEEPSEKSESESEKEDEAEDKAAKDSADNQAEEIKAAKQKELDQINDVVKGYLAQNYQKATEKAEQLQAAATTAAPTEKRLSAVFAPPIRNGGVKGVLPKYMECWMEKRGPTDTYKWMKRYCVLYEDKFAYFRDSECKEAKGDVKFKPYSKLIAFEQDKAPGDAIKYKASRPFGFVLDPDPNGRKDRRMHYFDAVNEEILRSVISNFDKATEGLQATIRETSSILRSMVYLKTPSLQAEGSFTVDSLVEKASKTPPESRVLNAGAPPEGRGGAGQLLGQLGELRNLGAGVDMFTLQDDDKFAFTYSLKNEKMATLKFQIDASGCQNMGCPDWDENNTASIDVEPMSTTTVGTLERVDTNDAASIKLSFQWSYQQLDKEALLKLEAANVSAREKLAALMRECGAVASGVKGGSVPIEKRLQQAELDCFLDVDFPPGDAALFQEPGKPEHPPIIWRRPADFMDSEISLFPNNNYKDISPHDIKQGALGDCWFLASIAALAEFPELILKLFPQQQCSKYGVYEIACFKNGKETTVIVDDYFPCNPCTQKPCYSHSPGNYIWVMLLEKAWAKLHGSYERIESGVPVRAMMDLCGCPGRSISFHDDDVCQEVQSGQLFDKLCDYDDKGFLMVTGTPGYDDMSKHEDLKNGSGGIVPGHAYTLKTARTESGGSRLMEMRNPWGKYEWNGDWCDKSDRWTADKLDELSHTLDQDDGLFWISDKDVFSNFVDAHVVFYRGNIGAKYEGNYWAESRTEFVTTDQDMCSELLQFEVSEPAFGFLTLHQRDCQLVNTPEYIEFAFALFGPCDGDKPAREVLRSARWINRELVEEIPESKPLAPGKYLVAVYNVTKTPDVPVVLVTHLSMGSDDTENHVPTSTRSLTPELREELILASATTSDCCSLNDHGPLSVAMSFLPGHGFALAAQSKATTALSVDFDFSGCDGLELVGNSKMVSKCTLKPGSERRLVAELRPTKDAPSFGMALNYRQQQYAP